MGKHTPGPWNIRAHDDGQGIYMDGSRRARTVYEIGAPFDPNGKTYGVAKEVSSTYNHVCTIAENEANAHLIAAAPEMLEALEMLIEVNAHERLRDTASFDFVLKTIAKARGEA